MLKSLVLLSAGALAALALSAFVDPSAQAGVEKAAAAKPARAKPDVTFDGTAIAAISVRDLAAAKAWYGEVLGCEVVYELAEQGWCEVSTPVAKTMIGLAVDEAAPGSAGATFALGVADVAKARAWLASKKVKMEEVVEIPKIVKLLYFEDPDGNKLMFYEAYKAN